MKANVRAVFDSLALEYVQTRERQVSFRALKRIVIDMLAGARGRLLEIGCGPAVMTPELLAMGFEVQGIDVSSEMVRRAGSRAATSSACALTPARSTRSCAWTCSSTCRASSARSSRSQGPASSACSRGPP